MTEATEDFSTLILPRFAALQALTIEILAHSGASAEIIAAARLQFAAALADPRQRPIGAGAMAYLGEVERHLAARQR